MPNNMDLGDGINDRDNHLLTQFKKRGRKYELGIAAKESAATKAPEKSLSEILKGCLDEGPENFVVKLAAEMAKNTAFSAFMSINAGQSEFEQVVKKENLLGPIKEKMQAINEGKNDILDQLDTASKNISATIAFDKDIKKYEVVPGMEGINQKAIQIKVALTAKLEAYESKNNFDQLAVISRILKKHQYTI